MQNRVVQPFACGLLTQQERQRGVQWLHATALDDAADFAARRTLILQSVSKPATPADEIPATIVSAEPMQAGHMVYLRSALGAA